MSQSIPNVHLRYATIDDAPQIVRIYAPYVLNHPYTFELEVPSVEEYKERIKDIMKFFPFFVLEEENGHILGYSCAHYYHPRMAYQWEVETTIYIEEGHHRKGYGSILYKPLLAALKEQGFMEALAILGCPNDPSVNFHKKLGFELRWSMPKMGFQLGEWHDVTYLSYKLNEKVDHPKDPVAFNTLDASKFLKIDL